MTKEQQADYKKTHQDRYVEQLGIIAAENDSGKVLFFFSTRDAARELGIPKSTVQYALTAGNRTKHGWKFTRYVGQSDA